MTTQPMTNHPINAVLALPGVLQSTKDRAAFLLSCLGDKPNVLKRKVIGKTLTKLKAQAQMEHSCYGHRVTK